MNKDKHAKVNDKNVCTQKKIQVQTIAQHSWKPEFSE